MNTIESLFSLEELEKYRTTAYPFNLSILSAALERKLKERPDYEVFVPMLYYKCTAFLRNRSESTLIAPYKYFISNKGNVVSLRRRTPSFIGGSVNKRGYPRINVQVGVGRQIKVLLHRALACSFIPVKKELGVVHPKDLQVNHIDGIKINCTIDNLEWCTALGNMEHASATGLVSDGLDHYSIKPVKGTVLTGRHKGYEFLLIGTKEIETAGFDKAAVSRCCLGIANRHLNCSFSFASVEEISGLPRGLAEDIILDLQRINPKVRNDIIAENIETGEMTHIKGGKPQLLSLGFDESAVSKVLHGKLKTHRGYSFRRAV